MSLTSLSPLDGRYSHKMEKMRSFFSEEALIKSRVKVEIKYVIFLCQVLNQSTALPFYKKSEEFILNNWNILYAQRVKKIESEIHHDVKAVEIFIRETIQDKFKTDPLFNNSMLEWIHFGLTSQDINHLAFLDLYRDYINYSLEKWNSWVELLTTRSSEWMHITMLAKTHGQPATPTTLGHEMMVFIERWNGCLSQLREYKYRVKFGGATGGLHAHKTVFPNIDWEGEMDNFISSFQMKRQQYTTQIDHYDPLAESFDIFTRLSTISIDFCRDIWSYISMNYLILHKINEKQVGSSTMPHKVNPIHFEQAEGNLSLAVSILQFLSRKLPISRLQRDLTDSTVGRNIGMTMGYIDLSLQSMITGFKQIDCNQEQIKKDLELHPEVFAETAQSYLRACGLENPYQLFKSPLQGQQDPAKIKSIIKEIITNAEEKYQCSKKECPGQITLQELLSILN